MQTYHIQIDDSTDDLDVTIITNVGLLSRENILHGRYNTLDRLKQFAYMLKPNGNFVIIVNYKDETHSLPINYTSKMVLDHFNNMLPEDTIISVVSSLPI